MHEYVKFNRFTKSGVLTFTSGWWTENLDANYFAIKDEFVEEMCTKSVHV